MMGIGRRFREPPSRPAVRRREAPFLRGLRRRGRALRSRPLRRLPAALPPDQPEQRTQREIQIEPPVGEIEPPPVARADEHARGLVQDGLRAGLGEQPDHLLPGPVEAPVEAGGVLVVPGPPRKADDPGRSRSYRGQRRRTPRKPDVERLPAEEQGRCEDALKPVPPAPRRYPFEALRPHGREDLRHVAQPHEALPVMPRAVAHQIHELVLRPQGLERKRAGLHRDAAGMEALEGHVEPEGVVRQAPVQIQQPARSGEQVFLAEPAVPAVAGRRLPEVRLDPPPAVSEEHPLGGAKRSWRNQQIDVPRVPRQRVPVEALAERQALEHQAGDAGGVEQTGRPLQRGSLGQSAAHAPFGNLLESRLDAGGRAGGGGAGAYPLQEQGRHPVPLRERRDGVPIGDSRERLRIAFRVAGSRPETETQPGEQALQGLDDGRNLKHDRNVIRWQRPGRSRS